MGGWAAVLGEGDRAVSGSGVRRVPLVAVEEELMFHVEHGLTFERLTDGSVRIRKYREPFTVGSEDMVEFQVTLEPDRWASVLASLSPTGESADTYQEARKYHAGGSNAEGRI